MKRVLFLADRTALVKQAANAFKKHLPGSGPVNLVTEKTSRQPGLRLHLSDDDGADRRDETGRSRLEARFGAGHFDLVVIDEAHRSVYQNIGAIFGTSTRSWSA